MPIRDWKAALIRFAISSETASPSTEVRTVYTKIRTRPLSLEFHLQDTTSGITRLTLRALARELKLSERQVVLLALARLANEKLPAYLPDDGPVTMEQIHAIQSDADAHMPKGRVMRRMALFK